MLHQLADIGLSPYTAAYYLVLNLLLASVTVYLLANGHQLVISAFAGYTIIQSIALAVVLLLYRIQTPLPAVDTTLRRWFFDGKLLSSLLLILFLLSQLSPIANYFVTIESPNPVIIKFALVLCGFVVLVGLWFENFYRYEPVQDLVQLRLDLSFGKMTASQALQRAQAFLYSDPNEDFLRLTLRRVSTLDDEMRNKIVLVEAQLCSCEEALNSIPALIDSDQYRETINRFFMLHNRFYWDLKNCLDGLETYRFKRPKVMIALRRQLLVAKHFLGISETSLTPISQEAFDSGDRVRSSVAEFFENFSRFNKQRRERIEQLRPMRTVTPEIPNLKEILIALLGSMD